jgi:hypothetical protein
MEQRVVIVGNEATLYKADRWASAEGPNVIVNDEPAPAKSEARRIIDSLEFEPPRQVRRALERRRRNGLAAAPVMQPVQDYSRYTGAVLRQVRARAKNFKGEVQR